MIFNSFFFFFSKLSTLNVCAGFDYASELPNLETAFLLVDAELHKHIIYKFILIQRKTPEIKLDETSGLPLLMH